MKPKLIVLTPAIVVAALSFTTLAQDQNPTPARPQASSANQPGQRPKRAPLSMLVKASDIIGLEVRNYQDEKLGKIEDLVVDVGPERITGLVVGVGGILGVGEKPVIVPMSAFHYDSDKKLLHLDNTKGALKAAPRFELVKGEEFNQQAEVAEVYRYYRAAPYFGENAGVRDNSSSDKLPDRSGTLPAPIDQGNNAHDLQVTAQIRKDVMAQSDLSTAAKNIKIITANGRVTLRGTVATDAERQLIQRLAETAAPNQVDNQLEVQSATKK